MKIGSSSRRGTNPTEDELQEHDHVGPMCNLSLSLSHIHTHTHTVVEPFQKSLITTF